MPGQLAELVPVRSGEPSEMGEFSPPGDLRDAEVVVGLELLPREEQSDVSHGFGADQAWLYVAIVTAAYVVSRGIAKSGVRKPDGNDDDRRDVNGRSN